MDSYLEFHVLLHGLLHNKTLKKYISTQKIMQFGYTVFLKSNQRLHINILSNGLINVNPISSYGLHFIGTLSK